MHDPGNATLSIVGLFDKIIKILIQETIYHNFWKKWPKHHTHGKCHKKI